MDGRLRAPTRARFAPEQFFLTDPMVDFTLVALGDPWVGEKYGWKRLAQDEVKAIVGEYLSLVQHARGSPKQVVLRELQIVDIGDPFFHCATDALTPSSGAPLFNDQWEVVGMLRASVPALDDTGHPLTRAGNLWSPGDPIDDRANLAVEAVRISRILAAVRRASFGGDKAVLVEEMLYSDPRSLALR